MLTAALLSVGNVASIRPASGATPASRPTLTAQTTEGPYYFDPGLVRADITEGLPGIPLDLALAVRDEQGQPLAGARVDVWHCDASGLYSGYDGQGEDGRVSTRGRTFLRGSQFSDGDGRVNFRSVYPGWYEGRTTHIHFKVLYRGAAVLTSQFFLPDALSEYIYTHLPAYRRAHLRAVLNSNDGIALQAGGSVLGAVREADGRYVASLDVAVDRLARPQVDRPPQPGAGMPPDRPPPDGVPPRREASDGAARVAALVPGARQAR